MLEVISLFSALIYYYINCYVVSLSFPLSLSLSFFLQVCPQNFPLIEVRLWDTCSPQMFIYNWILIDHKHTHIHTHTCTRTPPTPTHLTKAAASFMARSKLFHLDATKVKLLPQHCQPTVFYTPHSPPFALPLWLLCKSLTLRIRRVWQAATLWTCCRKWVPSFAAEPLNQRQTRTHPHTHTHVNKHQMCCVNVTSNKNLQAMTADANWNRNWSRNRNRNWISDLTSSIDSLLFFWYTCKRVS